ncbi:YkgJ family cysteine cluster protein [Loktanella salsilacus]|uniref:YkgJ family cysteine cluster protein n=1 Tax=Loktanella salsilacus TaxID=195913 RepID=UPI003703FB4A
MTKLDCQACGACCTHAGDVAVYAQEDNVPEHLTRSVRGRLGFGSWEVEQGTRVMAKTACNTCTALRIKNDQFSCRIYENRPAVCREFKAGSKECFAARKLAGLV